MNKKLIFFSIILLIVCFSAGIFTEIVTPLEKLSISAILPSPAIGIINYIKNDFFTVIAVMIFSGSVFFLPLVPLTLLGKTFSLGFSASYILSSAGENGLGILLTALLPRGMFKIPTYLALFILSLNTTALIKNNFRKPAVLKKGCVSMLINYLLCFLALALSSLLEVIFLQGVL